MIQRVPAGFSSEQWSAVTSGLETHPSTINDYRKVINLLCSRYNYDVFSMSKEQAETFFSLLDTQQENGELSANTVHRYKATLRSIGARIESSGIIPGYQNPFSGLVKNESRDKTSWKKENFARVQDVQKIFSIYSELSPEDRLILTLMLRLGLTPMQIQNIRVSDFSNDADGRMNLLVDQGTVLEYTSESWKDSGYANSGLPLKYVKRSPGRTITWRYFATCIITPAFARQLIDYNSLTGASQDTRSYFMTTRHLEFNYRAMHHMVSVVLEKAGLTDSGITPTMLSNYGKVRTFIQNMCEQRIQEGTDEHLDLWKKRYEQIRKEGIIGSWKDAFPLPLQETINEITKALGADFLFEAAGLE